MGRGWKIAIGVLAGLAVLLLINMLVTDADTQPAEVTEPGGEIISQPGGDLELVEAGSRDGSPIVLVHCFTCAINYWDEMIPRLASEHRVIAIDLLGHGGSAKPTSGYTVPNQADLIAGVLGRRGVRDAVVVGHSLGGAVVTALAQQSPQLAARVVIIDTPPAHEKGDLGLLAKLVFTPVIGQGLWRVKTDFTVRKGLEVAFAPGFDVPDEFVEDVKRMTYNAYHDSAINSQDYAEEEPLDERMRDTGKPLLVIMGAEEQIIDDPPARLAEYRRTVPGVRTVLIEDAGHSPNVEKPARTAALVAAFSVPEMQKNLQKQGGVRGRP